MVTYAKVSRVTQSDRYRSMCNQRPEEIRLGDAPTVRTRGQTLLYLPVSSAYGPQVAMSELGVASAEVLAQLCYDLPASYAFHRCRRKPSMPWHFS